MAGKTRGRSLVKPVLFSQKFKGTASALKKEGLFDPILNSDSKLFVDPLLIEGSSNGFMKAALTKFEQHFTSAIRLLAASKKIDDPAWKAARNYINLDERSETCLGYGGSSTSGSSRSKVLQEQILNTTHEIIQLGESDPQIISLMAMFEEGIGADTISDMTTTAILDTLGDLTEDFCTRYKVSSRIFASYNNRKLPENPYDKSKPILLVPRDILRDLPLAADWSDVSRVALENEEIRKAFNNRLGVISEATLTEKKEALRKAALSSLDNFQKIFNSVIGSSDSYDPNADPLNLYRFRELISGDTAAFKQPSLIIGPPSSKSLRDVVNAVMDHFKFMIEKNNLWELLWHKDQPKRERAAQLLFFAVADVFCKANNIDVSPETNSGGGPVDFKFSSGYHSRIVVEIKLSKGRVVHGYKTQVGIYQSASDADDSIFLLINVNGMGDKLDEIRTFEKAQIEAGKKTAKIVLIDGRRRTSASIRHHADDVINDVVTDDEADDT